MSSFTIRQQLIALAAAALISVLVLAGAAFYSITVIEHDTESLATNWMPSISTAHKISESFKDFRRMENRYIFVSAGERPKVLEGIKAQREKIDALLAQYEPLISSPEERALFNRFKEEQAAFEKAHDLFMRMMDDDMRDDATGYFIAASAKAFDTMLATVQEIVEINEAGGKESFVESQETTHFGFITMGVVSLLAFVMVGTLSFMVLKAIGVGMGDLGEAFTALSNLNLRMRGNIRGKDEISQAMRTYNTTVDRLTQVVRTTQEAAASVSAPSHELSAGMQSISAIAGQQETALNQIAAALEETSSTASEVNTKSSQSGEATERVANEIRTVMNTVGELRKSAQEIGSARDVIQEISEQINLLSLNAAIEAARAGDAGRGFAVVADEVRKLAGSTSSSTGEIAKMVEQLQNIVDRTSAALESVNSLLDNVRTNSRSVVTAVAEQTQAVGDIARNIHEFRDQMASVISNVRESQNAAESLSTSAEELNRQAAQFQV